MRQPRDADALSFEKLGHVMRRGLAIDRGVQRQDDLADAASLDPRDQGRNVQIVRRDPVNGGENPAKHMIAAAKCAPTLQRPEIRHILHHADERIIAPVGLTHRAGLDRVEIPADLAPLDLLARLCQRVGQRFQQCVTTLQQEQGNAPRRAGPEARQARDQLNQAKDFRTGRILGHGVQCQLFACGCKHQRAKATSRKTKTPTFRPGFGKHS